MYILYKNTTFVGMFAFYLLGLSQNVNKLNLIFFLIKCPLYFGLGIDLYFLILKIACGEKDGINVPAFHRTCQPARIWIRVSILRIRRKPSNKSLFDNPKDWIIKDRKKKQT